MTAEFIHGFGVPGSLIDVVIEVVFVDMGLPPCSDDERTVESRPVTMVPVAPSDYGSPDHRTELDLGDARSGRGRRYRQLVEEAGWFQNEVKIGPQAHRW